VVCLCLGVEYGNGVYFDDIFYSSAALYCMPDKNEHKYVFQCRVLTGSYCSGYYGLMEPPARDKESLKLYDSVVDFTQDLFMFVIFQDHRAYPESLITFQSLSPGFRQN